MSNTNEIPSPDQIKSAERNYSLYSRLFAFAIILTGFLAKTTLTNINNSDEISGLLAIDAFVGVLDLIVLNLFLSSKNDLDNINQIGRDLMKESTWK